MRTYDCMCAWCLPIVCDCGHRVCRNGSIHIVNMMFNYCSGCEMMTLGFPKSHTRRSVSREVWHVCDGAVPLFDFRSDLPQLITVCRHCVALPESRKSHQPPPNSSARSADNCSDLRGMWPARMTKPKQKSYIIRRMYGAACTKKSATISARASAHMCGVSTLNCMTCAFKIHGRTRKTTSMNVFQV